jgi:hypothetical protein
MTTAPFPAHLKLAPRSKIQLSQSAFLRWTKEGYAFCAGHTSVVFHHIYFQDVELPLDTSTPKRSFFKDAENSIKSKIRPKVSELRRRRKSSSNEVSLPMTAKIIDESNDYLFL